MYLDAVLNKDTMPVFNDTPEKVREWLSTRRRQAKDWKVCVGKTLQVVSVDEYMQGE